MREKMRVEEGEKRSGRRGQKMVYHSTRDTTGVPDRLVGEAVAAATDKHTD